MPDQANPHFLPAAALLLSVAGSSPEARTADPVDPAGALHQVPAPRRFFVSGHSLTDRPFPDYLAAIGAPGREAPAWNMQHLFGSSVKDRSSGGFRRGVDRHGRPMDVLRELGMAVLPYDALILAEQHTLVESLVWQDMIGSVLSYETRFHAANPNGRTYLFSTWLNLDRPDDPQRWLRYERAAAGAWRCTVGQINRSLASRGTGRRVILIPAAEGLAALVSTALAGKLPRNGIGDPARVIANLFADDVHLKPAGTYYVALLAYGVLHGELPVRVGTPKEVSLEMADALQRFARVFLSSLSQEASALSEAGCRDYLAKFVPHYLSYVRDVRWSSEGIIRARLKWIRFRLSWPMLFRGRSSSNPLRVRA